jgi:D-aminopeptidase
MTTSKSASLKEQAERAEQVLREAVREELQRKSKLGQYAVVYRDGQTRRVPAGELVGDNHRK